MNLGLRSHCSVFVMMHFCCTKATRSHYSVFVQKRSKNIRFFCVHTNLPSNKYGAKDIRFYAFILLQFSESHCWTLEGFQKTYIFVRSYLSSAFSKPLFLWISTFDSAFENLRFFTFCADQCEHHAETKVFLSFFVQSQSSVNEA